MTLHIITGTSAAARLDSVLDASYDVLLLEESRLWNQHEATNLDPIQHTSALQRIVLTGRPSRNRAFEVPQELARLEAVRRGDPICVWSARNLDDVMLSLWLFNHLDGMGYAAESISFVWAFHNVDGDPVSSVEQLADGDVARLVGNQQQLCQNGLAVFRDKWASLMASDPNQFAKTFGFDYSAVKGWQDTFLSVLQRIPSATWGHAPEVVILLECLRLANWDERKAFVQYATQAPFSPSKLRQPDAKAILSGIRAEAEKAAFQLDTVERVANVLVSANSSVSRFCVPFFWRDSLKRALPAGIGARVLS